MLGKAALGRCQDKDGQFAYPRVLERGDESCPLPPGLNKGIRLVGKGLGYLKGAFLGEGILVKLRC